MLSRATTRLSSVPRTAVADHIALDGAMVARCHGGMVSDRQPSLRSQPKLVASFSLSP
jgi:hypothetical protein